MNHVAVWMEATCRSRKLPTSQTRVKKLWRLHNYVMTLWAVSVCSSAICLRLAPQNWRFLRAHACEINGLSSFGVYVMTRKHILAAPCSHSFCKSVCVKCATRHSVLNPFFGPKTRMGCIWPLHSWLRHFIYIVGALVPQRMVTCCRGYQHEGSSTT